MRPQFNSWVRKIHWRRDRLPIPVFLGFPSGSAGKESGYEAGDLGSIPGLGRSPGKGNGYPLQYSGLENAMELQRVKHDWLTFTYNYPKKRSESLIWRFFILKIKKEKTRLRSETDDRINRQGCENSHYNHSSRVLEGRLHERDEENGTYKKDPNWTSRGKKIPYLKQCKATKTCLHSFVGLYLCSLNVPLKGNCWNSSPLNLLFFHPSPLRWLCLGAG